MAVGRAAGTRRGGHWGAAGPARMGKSNNTNDHRAPARTAAAAAKIQTPRLSRVLTRERLFARLDAARERAATWVFGPPGAGKTTLAASWLRARGARALWYQLDAGDADPASFFHYLELAAAQLSARAAATRPRFSAAAAMTPAAFAREFFRSLFAAHRDLVLAFDNVQDVPEGSGLADLLLLACVEGPAGGHVLFMSRQPPPACFARSRLDGALQAIGPAELAATPEEVAQLAETLGTRLGPDEAQALQEHTGGWVAGLRLALELGGATALARAPPAALEDYFAREVLSAVAPETEDILLRTSALPLITAGSARAVAGPGALPAISGLAGHNYFTTAVGGDEPGYRFHPMFHQFLARRARERMGEPALKELAEAGARALEAEGRWEAAAVALMRAELAVPLSELIRRHARELVQSARFGTLAAWICQLPEAIVAADPWLGYWLAECLLWLEPPRAEAQFEAAHDRFLRNGDVPGQLLAGAGTLNAIFNAFTDLARLDRWVESVGRLFEAHESQLPAEVSERVVFSMFVALTFRHPDHPQIKRWLARARATVERTPDPGLRAHLWLYVITYLTWVGELESAADELRSMERECREELRHPVVRTIRGVAGSALALFRGDIEACIASASRGLEEANEAGLHLWDDVLLAQSATAHLSIGAVEKAAPLLARLELMVAARPPRAAHYHTVAAVFDLARGDVQAADRHGQRAVACAQAQGGTPLFVAIAHQCAVVARLARGDAAGAAPDAQAAAALALRSMNPRAQWFSALVTAHLKGVACAAEEALTELRDAFATGTRCGYTHYFFWPRGMIAELCARALEADIEPEYARGLVRRWKLPPPAGARTLEAWPWELKLRTLGGFALEVSGETPHFEGKAQRAPLALLKALIAFGGEGVPETKLMDALWPDSEGAAAQQALATTLFRLRKLVGEGVVARGGGRLTLDPEHCWVDALALQRLLADAAIRDDELGPRLLALYPGPFLAGEEDCPWALPLREKLHARVIRALERCAEGLAARGRHAEALALYERGVELDELVEGFYRGMMRCQQSLGFTCDALRTYRRCEAVLKSRLGVEPSAATRRLRAELAGRSA